ncbi:MAG: hypothetical protein ABWY16_09975 [Pedobacter sp.]
MSWSGAAGQALSHLGLPADKNLNSKDFVSVATLGSVKLSDF